LRKAIELGGEPVRDVARKDQRFEKLRTHPEFQKLVPSSSQYDFSLPMPGM
jgi:hypothetical protein